MFGIDYLLSPYNFNDFIANQWGKKAIHIPGEESKFQGLLDWEDINYLVRYSIQGGRSTRLVKEKNALSENEFSRFNQQIMEGATYVINHLQEKHANVDNFTRILSAELNTFINVNCYISKPQNQGFDTHYDRHNVFIINLEGTKHWKVYKPTLEQPIELMQGPKGPAPEIDPYLECDMTPGDVLYIPRGHWHYALSSVQSIHLTVGPQSRTPIEFLFWYLQREIWNDEYLRTDFPIAEAMEFNGRITDNTLANYFGDFQEYIQKKLSEGSLFQEFQEYIMCQNRISNQLQTQFPQFHSIKEEITVNTEFTMPIGQKVVMKYDTEKSAGLLYVRGQVVVLENVPEDILAATFHQGEIISGEKIISACDSVDWEIIKNYLLTLLEKDVICLVEN